MTFIEKFDSIKKKFSKPNQSKLTENFAVQINLTDSDCGGAFYIAYMNDTFAVEPYDYHDHTAMVTTDAKTFEGFLTKKKTVKDMSVDGNENHVEMIALAIEKKPAAKKKTVKKTSTKSTAKKDVKPVEKEETKSEVKETVKKVESAVKKAEMAIKKAAKDIKKK